MATLSPQDRALCDANRKSARETEVRTRWYATLDETRALMPQASALFTNALAHAEINLRELWLVLGVFETLEKGQEHGKSESCQSRWFDRIAPRAREGYPHQGVAGYTSRTAAKLKEFLRGSKNGYVHLTPMGYALAQWLREQHAELLPKHGSRTGHEVLSVAGLGDFPAPLWRRWNDWS